VLHSVAQHGERVLKPNWVCTTCGMWSSRKSSVKRHIHNLHMGQSTMVKYIDYLTGRQSGLYVPASSPDIGSSYQDHIADICTEEMWREKARITARKMYE
jgi:hypothetical protein